MSAQPRTDGCMTPQPTVRKQNRLGDKQGRGRERNRERERERERESARW